MFRVVAALLAALALGSTSHHHHHRNPCHRGVGPVLCTKRLARSWYGWTGSEWTSLNSLVNNESGWDYCIHYSMTHDCKYMGTNACGIPQRYYCPPEWQGHLDKWRRQVFWMLHYIHDRWGDPINAYYHETHGGY